MISQVVLLRELVLFFTGNELTLGIILAFWLSWTAVGSGLISRLLKFVKRPVMLFISCQFLLTVSLPLIIIFIRSAKQIFSIPIGEIVSPIFLLVLPFLALAPVGIMVGFLYTLGCQLLSQTNKETDSSVPGRIFLFEAIGSGVAGFIASVILFRFFENFQIILIVGIVNLSVAFFIWVLANQRLWRLIIFLLAFSIGVMFIVFPKLDNFSTQKMWGVVKLLRSETTIYGNLAVTGLEDSKSFYENGVLMFTHPDLMSAEESVHFALLEHPDPQKVLLIGGDVAGILPQVLYLPSIKKVDFVLLDPNAIRLAQKYLPSVTEILKDERIKIWHQDGRLFLNRSTTAQYDIIIINLPDPQTALINRFYTQEFFQLAKSHLTRNGILSFSMTSSENVLSDEQTLLLNCLYQTMAQSFNDIVLIPGNSVYFIGCVSENILTDDAQQLVQRLQQRNLPTVYVREYYIPFRMRADRMKYINEKVAQNQTNLINRDFRPIGYFYSIVLWLTSFKIDLKKVLHFLNQWNIIFMIVLIASPLMIRALVSAKRQGSPGPVILLTIIMIGFSAISLEVVIILGFQAIYGYAYYQLALIMSGYMTGLMFGSWYSLRAIQKSKSGFKNFVSFQIIMTGYPLLTFTVLFALSKMILPALLIQLIFLLLIVGAGFIGGYQFPLATDLIFQGREKIERVGGMLYASDLFGSVIGALMTSTILVPILGLGYTCVVFSLLNFGVTAILLSKQIFN